MSTNPPPRKLGSYGTSAFKAPSRSQLEALDKKKKTIASTSTKEEQEEHQHVDEASQKLPPQLEFSPLKSSFDKAASKTPRGVIAARMRSTKSRFGAAVDEQRNTASFDATSSSSTENNNSKNSPMMTEFWKATTDDPKASCTIASRVKKHSVIGPSFGRSGGKSPSRTTTPSRARTPPAGTSSSASPAAAVTKIINNVDIYEATTIGYKAQQLAKANKMDPVFASTAPRFRSLASKKSNKTNTQTTTREERKTTTMAEGDDEFCYVPKGLAETATEKFLVRMSSTAPRFVEKHSVTERAEFYTPRGFADEVVRKNSMHSSLSRSRRRATTPKGTTTSSSSNRGHHQEIEYDANGEIIKPRFKSPERITKDCEMFVPKDGIADRVLKNASLSKNTSSFARRTPVREMRQKVEQDATEVTKQVSVDWKPKSFVEESLSKKDTAGFAFRSTTPRFVRSSKLNASSSSSMDIKNQTADGSSFSETKEHHMDVSESIAKARQLSASSTTSGRKIKPSPNFASKIPRFGNSKRATSDFVEEGGHQFVPTSFVENILRK